MLFGVAGAALAAALAIGGGIASAAPAVPSVNLSVGTASGPQDVSVTLQIMALLTVLSLAPFAVVSLYTVFSVALRLALLPILVHHGRRATCGLLQLSIGQSDFLVV